MKEKYAPSLDTGMLSLDNNFIQGGVFDNGNYENLNLAPVDKLICVCLGSKMSIQEIVKELSKRNVSISEEQINERIKLYQEMFASYCKSQMYFTAQKVTHPYRTK